MRDCRAPRARVAPEGRAESGEELDPGVEITRVGRWLCELYALDMDLDGRPDIALANGSTLEVTDDPRLLLSEPVFLFWNDGERFLEVSRDAGEVFEQRYWGRGLAAADFDADGDVDLAIVINRGQPLLLRNDTETENHSLTIVLQGPPAATFGAKVELVVGGQRQVRWYGADASYLSAHDPEFVFGLGSDEQAEELSVHWIGGQVTRLEDVPMGRRVVEYP